MQSTFIRRDITGISNKLGKKFNQVLIRGLQIDVSF